MTAGGIIGSIVESLVISYVYGVLFHIVARYRMFQRRNGVKAETRCSMVAHALPDRQWS